jgi:predicted glycosyltransferase
MSARPRLLFHVQHLLGIGHRVRAARIAKACAEAGFEVTLLDGGVPDAAPAEAPPGVTRRSLPPARAADAAFSALVDAETGQIAGDAWRARRAAAALAALEEARPDLLVVEGYPFARRAFAFELEPMIAEARAMGARTAVSIRDILVGRRDPAKAARIAGQARALFDRILVHSDPGFAQLADSFGAAPALADRTVYTGIVAPEPAFAEPEGDGDGEILVSAGGGATSAALMRAALAARPLSAFADRTWRLLTGPYLPPADLTALTSEATEGIVIEPARPDFLTLLTRARLSVSQAGYNTVADLAVSGCPAVLVPFEGPSALETEQPLRATLLARAGRAIHLPEPNLSGPALAAAVDAAAALPRRTGCFYRTGGAAAAAKALLRLLEEAPR